MTKQGNNMIPQIRANHKNVAEAFQKCKLQEWAQT